MKTGNALKESVSDFAAKKEACLKFMDETRQAVEEFEREFPAACDENSRLTPAAIRAVRDKIEESRLKILVAGQFKTGKSALVNAIIGQTVLPAYTTPCTAVITEVEYGDTPSAELHFKSGLDRENLPASLNENVREHILSSADDQPGPLSLDLASRDELEKYLVIDENEEDQAHGIAENPVSVCKLRWPMEFCHGEAVIIDSPGLNENGIRDRATLEYVPHADMVLHVLNAQQLYGMPDQQFIKSLELMGNFPLLFVVNRLDLVSGEKEKERVRSYAHKRLLPHTAYGKDGIFFTSAVEALTARINGDNASLEASGLAALEHRMAEIFRDERMQIKLVQILGVTRDLGQMASVFLPRLQKNLNEDVNSLENQYQEKENIITRLDSRIRRIRDLCQTGISAFQEQMQAELERLLLDFRETTIRTIVENTDLDAYNVTNDEGKTQATAYLIALLDNSLKETISSWQKDSGNRLYRQALEAITKRVEEEITDFNVLMNALDNSWTSEDIGTRNRELSISADAGGMMLAGGLAAGGGLAGMAALALLPARFLGEFGGPVGWLVIALTTGLGAALSYWSRSVARSNLKESFIRESQKLLAKDARPWATDLSMEAANSMGTQALLYVQELQKRIDDARRPVLAALDLLKKNRENIEQRKLALTSIQEKFQELYQKGLRLASGLGLEKPQQEADSA